MRWLRFAGLCAAALVVVASAQAVGPVLELSAPAAFSPNGDGVADVARIEVSLDRPAALSVDVLGSDGAVVDTLAAGLGVPAGVTTLTWAGAADGLYTVLVRAVGDGAPEASISTAVRVDTVAPRVAWTSLPGRVEGSHLRASVRAADAGETIELALVLAGRSKETWRSDTRRVDTGPGTIVWPLRNKGGGPLGSGGYRASLLATDEAGNRSTSASRGFVLARPVATKTYRRVEGAGRRVALTFDDCNEGDAWTRILDVLAARRLRASFFCLGPEVTQHPAQARRTLQAGHTIGNHTSRHRYLPALSFTGVRAQVVAAESPWWGLAQTTPLPYFRPPYGALDPVVLRAVGNAGYGRTVLWDVDPQDWRRPGAAAIADRAVGPARSGSIILLHVMRQTADALPSIVTRLRAKGLRPVSLDELFQGAR